MVYAFGVTLIAAILTAQLSEANILRQTGLLDGMPLNCIDKYYCLEPHEDYPQKDIDWLLTQKYQIELGSEHAAPPINRQGTTETTTDICEKTVKYGQIYEIVDEHDNIRVVVQSPNFKQEIRIEECVYPGPLAVGSPGPFGSDDLENNEIVCNEKTMDYSFLVLTKNGRGVESVRSKKGIPVCCYCKIDDVL